MPPELSRFNSIKLSVIRFWRSINHLLCFALRSNLKSGYTKKDFFSDLSAGSVVGLVAIPLALALAIASGVPPQHGLYTVIFAGFIVALLGGSKHQVTGPTAAFVVILLPIVNKFGVAGLLTAGFMAGIILLCMGVFRIGRFIKFIPAPVVTGFTAGIAVVIATIQLKDFFGLTITKMPESYFEKIESIFSALPSISINELIISAITLALLLLLPRLFKKLPAPLLVLPIISLMAFLANQYLGTSIATIGSRFNYTFNGTTFPGIPSILPTFTMPWNINGGLFSLEMVRQLVPSAIAIALLGAIESLLSAVVADGMAKTRHNSDSELLALGIGNIITPFFGGIPATGAIARTATNVRFGGKSPISAITHALFVLLVLLALAPLLAFIPMAAMASLLLLVAYNMSDVKHFLHICKKAPSSDIVIMFSCFLATVFVDMVAGVTIGMLLAVFLFMGKMAQVTQGRFFSQGVHHHEIGEIISKGVAVYDINGSLFFGSARAATEAILSVDNTIQISILSLDNVLFADFSGFLEIESAINEIKAAGIRVILCGLQPQPKKVFEKGGLLSSGIEVVASLKEAIALSKQ